MARYTKDDRFVRIFATTVHGQERLIAAVKCGSPRAKNGQPRGCALYDCGSAGTVFRYAVGAAPTKTRRFADSARDIQKAFKDAGIKAPRVLPARFIDRAAGFIFRLRTTRKNGEVVQRIG